jgi:putative endonuclease
MKHYYVYILTNYKNGTLYIGVTNNLYRRLQEHKDKSTKGFTQKYNLTKLVYYELYFDIRIALEREKNLKKWKRHWKLRIVESMNPLWEDIDPGSLPAQG